MFNDFIIEGVIKNTEEYEAPSGATKQIIGLEIDTSHFDKKNDQMREKKAIMKFKRYIKQDDDMSLQIDDYVICKGKIVASKNPDNDDTFVTFIVDDVAIL